VSPRSADADAEAIVTAVSATLRTGRRPRSPDGLGEVPGLDDLLDQIVEIARLAQALASGELDQELRRPGIVVGSLKSLQGALRHLSWQTQCVADGDLNQRVDFMGEFSAAFNSMVESLAEARETLQAQNAQLEELATTDALTGAWNRRKFNDLVSGEIERAQRYGKPLSLFILDIDHFKHVNDTYGHDVGDAVLRELAAVVRAQMRAVDQFARWGGEEFVVLSPEVPVAGCAELAERARVAVAAHVFPAVGTVTVSVGVAALQSGDTADALFSRADGALYAAKESGRDRVVTAE